MRKYLGNDIFKLDKFPLYLHYSDNGIVFYGDLVWDMKEKNFIKTDIKKLNKRFESK